MNMNEFKQAWIHEFLMNSDDSSVEWAEMKYDQMMRTQEEADKRNAAWADEQKAIHNASIANIIADTKSLVQPKVYKTKVQKLIAMCGVRMTALYLRKREYTLDEALQLMFPQMNAAQRNRMNHIQAIDTI